MALSQDDGERAPWNGVLLALIAIIAVQAVIIAASSKQGKQRLRALREWVRASTARHAPAAPAEPVSDAERAMRPLSQISVSQQKAIVADLVAASGAAHDQYAPDELWRSNSVLNERLDARLAQLGASRLAVKNDGNCQFRALSFGLFGATAHHARVRAVAADHMERRSDDFSVYFESAAAFGAYLKGIRADATWGDELTLRAVVEAYRCIVHVVTSEKKNFYLAYEPEPGKKDGDAYTGGLKDSRAIAAAAGGALPPPGTEVFLSYLLPVHYDAVAVRK